jgi:hypothetical protein
MRSRPSSSSPRDSALGPSAAALAALLGASLVGLALGLVGCPAPKSPKGPPPEYEEPAAPSWLGDGGTEAGVDAAPAPAPALVPPA